MFKKFTIMLMIIVFTSLIIGCGDNKTNISAETSTITETPNSEYVLEMPDSITVFPLKEDLIETGPFNTVVSEKYDELLRELIETKIPIRKGWKEPMWNSNVPEMQRVANKLPPGYERDFLILSMASLGHLPRKEPYSLPNDNDLYWYLIQNTDTPWIAGFAASRLYSSFVNSGQYEKALAIWS